MKRLERLLATLGPCGWAPLAPATVGSFATAAVGWFLPVPNLLVTLALIVLGFFIAVRVAGEAEKELGHDAKPIVIDEAVGQSIALLGVPHTLTGFFASFLLFRVFDVWKPFGAREAQHLPGGWGVVADDVIAGVVANVTFHLASFAVLKAFGWVL